MRRFGLSMLAGPLFLGLLLGAKSAYAQAGALDATFGNGGKVETNFGLNAAGAAISVVIGDAVLQPDGKIIVVANFSGSGFGVVRYLSDGALDTSFGKGGSTSTAFGNFIDQPNSVALQSDGKIVVAGETQSPTGVPDNFAIARFNANGTLDRSFGKGGKVTTEFFATPIGGVREAANAVLLQPDGKIIAAGLAHQGGKRAPVFTALARYNANGSLDTTFGGGGKVLATAIQGATTLGLDAAGDIFVLNHAAIAEFSPTGRLDSQITPATITAASGHGGVNAFYADGQYLFSTVVVIVRHSDTDAQVTRFNATGSADSTFNNAPFDFAGGGKFDEGGVAIEPNGQIVVGGSHASGGFTTVVFGLARLNSDGSLDSSFGSGGTLTTNLRGDDVASAILIQSDGKIIAIGTTSNKSTFVSDMALARYLGE